VADRPQTAGRFARWWSAFSDPDVDTRNRLLANGWKPRQWPARARIAGGGLSVGTATPKATATDRLGRARSDCRHDHRHALSEAFRRHIEWRTGFFFQYVAAAALFALAALATETLKVQWTAAVLVALGWLVFGLSVGAIWLLYFLIRHHAAARVLSLFYLTPRSPR